jgi:hypothetical protein
VKDPLPAGWLASQDMIIGYLVEAGNRILLRGDGKGGFVLPTARRRKADSRLVLDGGEALSLVPENTFLYSVFDVADSDPGYLIYRAELSREGTQATLPDGHAFFAVDALPYDQIATHELRAMLRRYARERQDKRFGIYMDSGDGGRVAMIDGQSQSWTQGASE